MTKFLTCKYRLVAGHRNTEHINVLNITFFKEHDSNDRRICFYFNSNQNSLYWHYPSKKKRDEDLKRIRRELNIDINEKK